MSLNACFSIIFFKIFPGNMPPTCGEHAKKSTFSKKSRRKGPLYSKIYAKNPTFSQEAHKKVHFRQKSTPQIQTWLRACHLMSSYLVMSSVILSCLVFKLFTCLISSYLAFSMSCFHLSNVVSSCLLNLVLFSLISSHVVLSSLIFFFFTCLEHLIPSSPCHLMLSLFYILFVLSCLSLSS